MHTAKPVSLQSTENTLISLPPTPLVLTRTILWSGFGIVNAGQQMENYINERQGDEFYLPVQIGELILYDSLDLVPCIQ